MNARIRYLILVILVIITGCQTSNKNDTLPYLGRKEIKVINTPDGQKQDTIYHTIDDFSFVDQDSMVVTNDTFRDKIYVADFFFTTCPTICPLMKAEMLRVYDKFLDEDGFMILSHTIDPDYDTVGVLRDFAGKLGVTSDKWHFVTGNKEKIYEIGQTSYMVTAMEDKDEPGGYIHSGAFILVDKERRVRGLYDGTSEKDVNRLINDIPRLLKEYEKN